MAAAAANLSTEMAVIADHPWILSSIGAGLVSVLRWLLRGVPYYAAFTVALVAGAVLLGVVAEEHARRRRADALARRRRQQRLRRRHRSRLRLEAVADVPYEQVASSSMVRGGPCVICRAEYEAGDRCGVLPRCPHVFHRDCIAAWLRRRTTCPICIAPVLLLAPPPPHTALSY